MDLAVWLRALDLERYGQTFLDHGIDGEVLPDLTDADLERIGVLLGHRKKILNAIALLRSSGSWSTELGGAPRGRGDKAGGGTAPDYRVFLRSGRFDRTGLAS
jgi:SAM domain (Sterile alpha motif)